MPVPPPDTPITMEVFHGFLKQGWDELWSYLNSLTPEQLSQKTDANGWTVKDHVVNLMMWEKGIVALLKKESRAQAMDFEDIHDLPTDELNAIMRNRTLNLTWEQVKAQFEQVHADLYKAVENFTADDLKKPYNYYEPSADDDPAALVVFSIAGNTFGHYEEHLPWIKAIAES